MNTQTQEAEERDPIVGMSIIIENSYPGIITRTSSKSFWFRRSDISGAKEQQARKIKSGGWVNCGREITLARE